MKTAIRNPKVAGELVEQRFWLAAVLRGLIPCRPYGDSQPFDFIVYCRETGRYFRIQVKSTSYRRRHAYRLCVTKGGRKCYTANEVDFVAAYIVPTKTWYIIPVQLLTKRKLISVYPHKPDSRGMFEPYRRAWRQLFR